MLLAYARRGAPWAGCMRDTDLLVSEAEYLCDVDLAHGQECESRPSRLERAGVSVLANTDSR